MPADVRVYTVAWPTDEYPNGHRVKFTIGVQTFAISAGDGEIFESEEQAEWMAQQLISALTGCSDPFFRSRLICS